MNTRFIVTALISAEGILGAQEAGTLPVQAVGSIGDSGQVIQIAGGRCEFEIDNMGGAHSGGNK